ncbi:MAG: Nif3-like dinuclear metal center hexameric protein [Mariniphaga sp.]
MRLKIFPLLLVVLFASFSLFGQPSKPKVLTANQIIEMIEAKVTCPWAAETVDTFKAGNPQDNVTGIAVCMFADMNVLKMAVAEKCNLIIAHEPTFYSHLDGTKILENDPVFQEKIKYINDNKLIIWRFHDHIHRTRPDGIYMGMIEKLGWAKNQIDSTMVRFRFDKVKLSDFIAQLKLKFPESDFRVVGNPDMIVTGVALAVGAPGSSSHMKLLQEKNIDLLIAGEAPEWETYQYVNDAVLQGKNKAVIFIGHTNSEEAGMDYCSRWLKGFVPQSIKIQYMKNGSSFKTY